VVHPITEKTPHMKSTIKEEILDELHKVYSLAACSDPTACSPSSKSA
jgi:hypothetical protein